MKIIDISVTVDSRTVVWPRTPKPAFRKLSSLRKGELSDDTQITTSVHVGTHLDAPSHFIASGKSIDKLPLDIFMGRVLVVDLPKIKDIAAEILEALNLETSVDRLLFKTSNSEPWRKRGGKFNKNYVGVTTSGARWLTKRKLKLIGVDYLSIAKFNEVQSVHQILLKGNIALLEGINLAKVKAGTYQLICLPTRLANVEAAPTRAILLTL